MSNDEVEQGATSTAPVKSPRTTAADALRALLNPEALREVAAALSPLLEGFNRAAQRFIEQDGPRKILEIVQAVRWWQEEAPDALREALVEAGYCPVPELTLADYRQVLTLYRERGRDAAADAFEELCIELFATPEFVESLCDRWEAYPKPERAQILLHCFKAFQQELFGAAVPSLLAQAEGIVVEMSGYEGKSYSNKIRELLRESHDDDLFALAVNAFLHKVVLSPFEHGKPVPALSRHAILHGGDVGFANAKAARKTILWVDYLVQLAGEKRTGKGTSSPEGDGSVGG